MLAGKSALVVEEEFLIALDLQRMLDELGASQVLLARSAAEAEELLRLEKPQVALIEQRSKRQELRDLALRLAASLPVVICSSDTAVGRTFDGHASIAVLLKPISEADLHEALSRLLDIPA